MCHFILALPVFGLVLFIVLPFPVALPLYLVVVAISVLMYAAVFRALRLPLATGVESMVGAPAFVVEPLAPAGLIRCSGELWRAAADEPIEQGARVWVARVERRPEGMMVLVHRTPPRDRELGTASCH